MEFKQQNKINMKVIQVNSLGFSLNKAVPETNEEYDNLARRGPNAACEDASASTLYRGTFPQFRDSFLDKVGEITGVARKTKESGKKDEDGNPVLVWDETEGEYWKRIKAEKSLSDEAAVLQFSPLAQECMDAATFDPSVKERKSAGPKAVAKTYLKIATSVVNEGKADRLVELLQTKLGREIVLSGDNEADIKVLAQAISDNEAREREQLQSKYAV